MAEYIEREAAKLRIFEYGVRHRNNSSISSACENLERQMNSIPAADVRPVKWIPVTERLPDKPGIYAVWTAKGFGNHLSTSCFDGDSWSLRITHWMPLPEPPKEE